MSLVCGLTGRLNSSWLQNFLDCDKERYLTYHKDFLAEAPSYRVT